MKVVCDANVLISGILFGGHPRRILREGIRGRLDIVISPDILEEFHDVLVRPKFGLTADQVDGIIQQFRESFFLVRPEVSVRVVKRDPDDDRILEAALAAVAPVIVSGDADLLDLKSWRGIRIYTPAEFVVEHLSDE